jgi:hypothetical protein
MEAQNFGGKALPVPFTHSPHQWQPTLHPSSPSHDISSSTTHCHHVSLRETRILERALQLVSLLVRLDAIVLACFYRCAVLVCSPLNSTHATDESFSLLDHSICRFTCRHKNAHDPFLTLVVPLVATAKMSAMNGFSPTMDSVTCSLPQCCLLPMASILTSLAGPLK